MYVVQSLPAIGNLLLLHEQTYTQVFLKLSDRKTNLICSYLFSFYYLVTHNSTRHFSFNVTIITLPMNPVSISLFNRVQASYLPRVTYDPHCALHPGIISSLI